MSPSDAELVYRFLAAAEPTDIEPADLIIGFGHFDLRIARHCADLWRRKFAPRILFTGGMGAGSADLNLPEAEAFAVELQRIIPDFPPNQILLESESTNTGENVRFSLAKLAAANWDFQSVILVATPFRQRRVNQTWAKVSGGISAQNQAVPSDLKTDIEIFASKDEDLLAQLPGEIERLITYPAHGWIADVPILSRVMTAAKNL
ncbi:MAG: YdcF family protein [Synoicihabitans sp.]